MLRLPDSPLSPSVQAKAYQWATVLNPDIITKTSWSGEDVVGRTCVLVVDVVEDQQGRKKNRIVKIKPPAAG